MCVHCQGQHLSNVRTSCPTFEKQRKIKVEMAEENISYKKAIEKLDNNLAKVITTSGSENTSFTSKHINNNKNIADERLHRKRRLSSLTPSELETRSKHKGIISI